MGEVGMPSGSYGRKATQECPCGYLGDRSRPCRCTAQQIRQYRGRISGPLLDRIDIHIEVPSVRYCELTSSETGEPSVAIKGRIEQARALQKRRFAGDETLCNARMTDRQVRSSCPLDDESRQLIEMAIDRLGLSARAYTRILKVARTIADLEGNPTLQSSHIAEAIQYRSLDRKFA
jgi:magnesium chelatase family protein